MATGKVDLHNLRVSFEKQVFNTNQFKGLAQGIAQRRANIAQNDMVEAFETHRVTKELEGGVGHKGDSIITYHSDEHTANLYSFIGFPSGTDPLVVLRKLLSKPIEVRLKTRSKNTYYFYVLAPSTEAIEDATPMPADYVSGTFSWARGVEDGDLVGIGQFLSITVSASRSGGGIQAKINTTSTIEKTPYISEILEAFRVKLEELSN